MVLQLLNTDIDFHCLLTDDSISNKEIVLWHCLYRLNTQLYSIIHCVTLLIRFCYTFKHFCILWYTFVRFCTLRYTFVHFCTFLFTLIYFWYTFDILLIHFCYTFDTLCYTFDILLIHYHLLRSVWLRIKIDENCSTGNMFYG